MQLHRRISSSGFCRSRRSSAKVLGRERSWLTPEHAKSDRGRRYPRCLSRLRRLIEWERRRGRPIRALRIWSVLQTGTDVADAIVLAIAETDAPFPTISEALSAWIEQAREVRFET